MYHSTSTVFMTDNMPSGAKKHRKSTETESCLMAKHLSFIFFFRQASSNLLDSFTIVLAQNSRILHWAVHQSISFSQPKFEVSQSSSNWSLNNYGSICDTLFYSLVHIGQNHLATKHNYYSRLLNYNSLCAWRLGEPVIHCRLGHGLKRAWSTILQPNTAYIYWGSLWGQTCCSVIDGKLLLKHASAAKEVT